VQLPFGSTSADIRSWFLLIFPSDVADDAITNP